MSSRVFGFNDTELKLLLVAVRQTRRMFQSAQAAGPKPELEPFAALYEDLYNKLLDMAGPVPENLTDLL